MYIIDGQLKINGLHGNPINRIVLSYSGHEVKGKKLKRRSHRVIILARYL